jgi:hypothetical protein
VNIKSFFVTTLSQALDLGLATCEDVVKHVTPDVLSTYLPRPLWARLLTACLGAPKVDATLVVETIGVPNLCEHVPASIIWTCILEIGGRALGNAPLAQPRTVSVSTLASPLAVAPPPPEKPRMQTPAKGVSTPVGPSIPAPGQAMTDLFNELEEDDKPIPPPSPAGRARRPSQDRFRQSNTGIGRLAQQNTARKPTTPAPAAAAVVESGTQRQRRGQTEADQYDVATDVADWKNQKEAIAVDDDQLVDWSSSEETVTTGDDYNRKR